MAKKESSNPKNVPTFQPPRSRGKWGWAILCFVVAVLLVVSFVDYRPEQSTQITTSPTDQNLVGVFGSVVSYYAFSLIGVSSWLIPVFLLWLSWILIRRAKRVAVSRIFAMLVCIVTLCGLAAMAKEIPLSADRLNPDIYFQGEGGLVGGLIYDKLLKEFLGPIGSLIIFVAAYGMAWFFVFTRDFGAQVEGLFDGFHQWKASSKERRAERRELKRLAKEAKKKQKLADKAAPPASPAEPQTITPPVAAKFSLEKRQSKEADAARKDAAVDDDESDDPATKQKAHAGLRFVAPEKTRKATQRPESKGNFIFPSLDILDEPINASGGNTEDEHAANAETLMRTLREFEDEVPF